MKIACSTSARLVGDPSKYAFVRARCLLLVDSPELHLHREQHAGFFDALRALMRRGQLVVTTS